MHVNAKSVNSICRYGNLTKAKYDEFSENTEFLRSRKIQVVFHVC